MNPAPTLSTLGRAYGFIKTDSSPQRIRQAFANMKAEPEVKVPKQLDMQVQHALAAAVAVTMNNEPIAARVLATSDADEVDQIIRISMRLWKAGANCMLRATLPGATHRQAADELGYVFNLMYSCTEILGEEAKPIANVFFRNENGIYVSKLAVEPR